MSDDRADKVLITTCILILVVIFGIILSAQLAWPQACNPHLMTCDQSTNASLDKPVVGMCTTPAINCIRQGFDDADAALACTAASTTCDTTTNFSADVPADGLCLPAAINCLQSGLQALDTQALSTTADFFAHGVGSLTCSGSQGRGSAQVLGTGLEFCDQAGPTQRRVVDLTATQTLSNKTIDTDSNVLESWSSVELPIAFCTSATTATSLWFLSSTATAAPNPICAVGANTYIPSLLYDDANDEAAQTALFVPTDWAGLGNDATIQLAWSSNATSGNTKWIVSGVCIDNDEDEDQALSALVSITSAVSATAANVLLTGNQVVALGDAGCSAGDYLILQVRHDGDDAADTSGGDASLHGVTMRFKRSQ